MKKQYFCNPLNMDYRYQFIQDMRSGEDKISREAADPSMILFQGKYYRNLLDKRFVKNPVKSILLEVVRSG